MNRETKIISLSNDQNVEILNAITWGEQQKIQGIIIQKADISISGSKLSADTMFEYEKFAIKTLIKEIKEGDNIIPFSDEWLENLSVVDGDKIWNEVNDIIEAKKK